jgi:glycosyltransferase involved in cell wall biosynthesis
MRVLHINSGNLFGGVETLLVTLARLRELTPDVEPEFALCFDGRLGAELRAAGVPVHALGEARVRYPFSVINARRRLGELINRTQFDTVVCHMAWTHAIFGPVVRSLEVPLTVWQHQASEGRHWLERWSRWSPANLVICNSHFTADGLPSSLRGASVEVIYCPVAPPPVYSEAERLVARVELETPADAVVIVMASRMQGWKGHTLLLKAASQLRGMKRWLIWIVGGPQRQFESRYLDSLREIVSDYGIGDRVRFTGERSDVERLLAAADIHCQPNQTPEPFGIAFIEALYARLPVVTTAIGGATEIIDDSCGVLVKPTDPTALAAALGAMISDGATRKQLGSCGPRRAHELCGPETQMNLVRSKLLNLSDKRRTIRIERL